MTSGKTRVTSIRTRTQTHIARACTAVGDTEFAHTAAHWQRGYHYEHKPPIRLEIHFYITLAQEKPLTYAYHLLNLFFYRKKHPLVGLALSEICKTLLAPDRVLTRRALVLLRELLWKHDLDTRYADPEARALIAAMYFPFLLYVSLCVGCVMCVRA